MSVSRNRVSERQDTYDVVVLDTVGLAPGAHDVGIVVGQNGDLVDTLGAELRELLDVLGNVVGGADRGESTCIGKAVSMRTL